MRLAKVDPLGGKLGINIQQRHEVAGKRCGAPRRLGAHHLGKRDLDHTHGQLGFHIGIFQNIIQYRQVGIPPRRHGFPVFLEATLLCMGVLFHYFFPVHHTAPLSLKQTLLRKGPPREDAEVL